MSSLTFVGRLLHDNSGLQYPWAACIFASAFARVPAMIRLPGTLRLGTMLRCLVNGDAA
jgi:hypothetical protein